MKKPMALPSPAPLPAPSNEDQIGAMLDALSLAQLTALATRVDNLRAEKSTNAKRDLIASFRAQAAELGLSLDDIVAPSSHTAASKPKTPGPKINVPPDWEARVIQHLERNEGRANARSLHIVVWPHGGAGSGSGGKLRGLLMGLVSRGILLILTPGKAGLNRTIYGLASMIDLSEEAAE